MVESSRHYKHTVQDQNCKIISYLDKWTIKKSLWKGKVLKFTWNKHQFSDVPKDTVDGKYIF